MGNSGSSGGGGSGGGGGNSSYGGSHPGYSQGSNGYGVPSSNSSAWSSNSATVVTVAPQFYPCSQTFEIPKPAEAYSGTSKLTGEKCTVSETMRADTALNSTMDTSVGSGGNQVSGMIMALQGVNYTCATENLEQTNK